MVAVHGRHDGRAKAAMLPERSVAQMVFATSMGWDLRLIAGIRRCSNFSRGRNAHRSDPHHGWLGHPVARFTPADWLAAVERDRITLSLLVPTMIYAVLDHPDLETTDLSTLETVMYGASPMSPAHCRGHRAHGSGVCSTVWPDRMCWHHVIDEPL